MNKIEINLEINKQWILHLVFLWGGLWQNEIYSEAWAIHCHYNSK